MNGELAIQEACHRRLFIVKLPQIARGKASNATVFTAPFRVNNYFLTFSDGGKITVYTYILIY